MRGDAGNRRQGDRCVQHQCVGLQAPVQGRQIGERLDRRAGLPQRLTGAVELAQRIGEAADHRQDAAGLVLQDNGRALHLGPDAQFGLGVASVLAFDDVDVDDVVDVKRVGGDVLRHRQRHGAAVVQADLDLPLAAVAQDNRGRPMHVVERQARALQRDLPDRFHDPPAPQRVSALFGGDARRDLAEIELRSFVFGPAAARLVAGEAVLQRLLGGALQLGIDGGAHRVGFRGQRLHADQGLGFAEQMVDEMETGFAPWLLVGHDARHAGDAGIDRLCAGDLVLLHSLQHIGKAFAGALRIAVGTEVARPLGHRGQHGALGHGQRRRRLLEVAACGGVDAPGAAAEIDRVEIDLEDFVLAQRRVDARRHDHLADLALVADVVADQQVLGDLLGDGRAALRAAGLRDVGDEGANEPALVDALVLIEPFVLGGDEGALHVFRHLRERHPDAALVGLEQLGELVALAVEHDARSGQLEVLQPHVIGQVRSDAVVELDHRLEIEARGVERFVAAELFVRDQEIVEVDAAERPDFAGDGLRVFHRGVDQRVEIEILDVEGLAHVRAAVLEDLHDRGLIVDRIEFGLERFRTRRHLRKRERGRKHFDEDQVHRV